MGNWESIQTSDDQMVCFEEQETIEKEYNGVFVRRVVYQLTAGLVNPNENKTKGTSYCLMK